MSRVAGVLLFSALSFMPVAAVANAEPQSRPVSFKSASAEALAQQLVEIIYARDSTNQWREQFLAQAAMLDCDCKGDAAAKQFMAEPWRSAVVASFNGDAIVEHLRRAMIAGMTTDEMRKVVSFYKTELGQKIHRAEKPEIRAAGTETQQFAEMSEWASRLEASPERKKVTLELIEKSGAVDLAANTLVNIGFGTAIGVMSAFPADAPRPTNDDILAQVESQRGVIQSMLRSMLPSAMSKIYRDLSVAELRAYSSQFKTPSHKKLVSVCAAAMNEALRAQAMAIGAAFTKDFSAQRS